MALLAVAGLACSSPAEQGSFSGLWTGSSTVFTQVTLNLAQVGDSVFGAATFVFTAPPATVADTDFAAATVGDSLLFTQPVPPGIGHSAIEFRGLRRADHIDAVASGAALVLTRH